MKDQLNDITITRAITPAVVSDGTAQVGPIIDRQGFNSVTFAIVLGTLADADATWTVTLEHGDNSGLSDTAAVPAADLVGTYAGAGFAFGDDNECREIGYIGTKRYLRMTIDDVVANTGAAPMAAVCILGNAQQGPVGQPA